MFLPWHDPCIAPLNRENHTGRIMMNGKKGGGFYSVMITGYNGFAKIPYVVFATSDWQAARLVREATGYTARPQEVDGPYFHP
jgi:hypothetical protein